MSGGGNTERAGEQRIALLARTLEAEDISRVLKMPLLKVEATLNRIAAQRGTFVVIRCNKTRRTWRSRSWRAAYLRAQILGLSDWDWWLESTRRDQ